MRLKFRYSVREALERACKKIRLNMLCSETALIEPQFLLNPMLSQGQSGDGVAS
jgi:hypothetical protein